MRYTENSPQNLFSGLWEASARMAWMGVLLVSPMGCGRGRLLGMPMDLVDIVPRVH